MAIVGLGGDADDAGLRMRFDTVLDRVLYQGLQDQIRNQAIGNRVGNIDGYLQAITKSGLFNVQVTSQKLHFLAEGHLMLIG